MNDLSRDARSLLAAARNVGVPGPRRQNIKRSVLLRVAAVTAASAGAGVAGATSLAGKVVLGSVLVTMVTGGTYGVLRWRSAEQASTHVARRAPAQALERKPPVGIPQPMPVQALSQQSPLGLGQVAAPERKLAARPPAARPTPKSATRSPNHGATGNQSLSPASGARSTEMAGPVQSAPPNPPASPSELIPAEVAPPTRAPEPAGPDPAPQAVEPQSLPRPGAELLPAWPAAVPHGRAVEGPGPAALPAAPDRGTLAREVALLRRAHQAVRDGKPQLALRVLADYDRDVPAGYLRDERAAIGVIAGCQAHPGPEARTQAEELLRNRPGAWLADGVRAACLAQHRGRK